jgi:hypothetical protein
MFNLDWNSLVKAASVSAAVAGLLYLIALTPFFNNVLLVLLLAGIILVPLGGGLYYGYLAPGEETMSQSVLGGALSGLGAGIIVGLAFGLNAVVMSAAGSFLGSIASGVGTSLIAGGIFGAVGAILGAIGGIIWKVVQKPEPST